MSDSWVPPTRTRRSRPLLVVVTLAIVGVGGWLAVDGFRDRGVERDEFEAAVDSIVQAEMEAGPIAGVTVAISRGIRVVFSQGYGHADVENQLPATATTVYRLGSITKQFTAAAILKLVDDGRVRLDAPVTEYLPDQTRYSEITIEQLLTHTGGVKDLTTIEGWWSTVSLEKTPRELLATFSDQPLDFQPGSRFAYSNSGYILLGLVIEAVTERPYGSYLNEFVFVEHGLGSTSYCDDRRIVSDRARGYDYQSGEVLNARHVNMSQAYSAGALCSNAVDLLLWTRLLTRGSVTGDDGFERMSTPATLSSGARIEYGYGVALSYLEGRHRMNHTGGMIGFTGQLAHYRDEDVTIAVLTNTERANAAKIETAIARRLFGLGTVQAAAVQLSDDELGRYTGSYDLGVTAVQVFVEDGRLLADVEAPGLEGRYELIPEGEHRFRVDEDVETTITFSVGEGRASDFTLLRGGLTLYGNRVE